MLSIETNILAPLIKCVGRVPCSEWYRSNDLSHTSSLNSFCVQYALIPHAVLCSFSGLVLILILFQHLAIDTTCSGGDIPCGAEDGPRICADPSWICDGEIDCPFGWDESPAIHNCSISKYACVKSVN